jgi:hypothetical protein
MDYSLFLIILEVPPSL